MKFYDLTTPNYEDDHERGRRNPVELREPYRIPGMRCEVCTTWGSSTNFRVPLPADVSEFAKYRFLTVDEWKASIERWSRLLGIPAELLKPGSAVGPPFGKCKKPIAEDVVHPFPGIVWVKQHVRDAFLQAGITGISFVQVQLSGKCGCELWEMVVHGRAWRKGSTEESLRLCEICGRCGFPSPKCLAVDEARWDGSDVFNVDYNPNIILVTEKVAELVKSKGFSNLAVIPIDETGALQPLS